MTVRTRYPCTRCLRRERCEWLIRRLREVVADAPHHGMPAAEVPEVYVDCEGRYAPASRLRGRRAVAG